MGAQGETSTVPPAAYRSHCPFVRAEEPLAKRLDPSLASGILGNIGAIAPDREPGRELPG